MPSPLHLTFQALFSTIGAYLALLFRATARVLFEREPVESEGEPEALDLGILRLDQAIHQADFELARARAEALRGRSIDTVHPLTMVAVDQYGRCVYTLPHIAGTATVCRRPSPPPPEVRHAFTPRETPLGPPPRPIFLPRRRRRVPGLSVAAPADEPAGLHQPRCRLADEALARTA